MKSRIYFDSKRQDGFRWQLLYKIEGGHAHFYGKSFVELMIRFIENKTGYDK